jgi:hypothetical protein
MFDKIKKIESIGIISDGIVSNIDVNDGTFLPAVIVHKDASKEFTQLIEIHKDLPSGDVEAGWWWNPLKKDKIFLRLEFKKPCKATLAIRLHAAEEFSILEAIQRYKALCIILGESGDKPSSSYGRKPTLLVEVTPSLMDGKWDGVAKKALTKMYRNTGRTKKDSQSAAVEHMKSLRSHLDFNRRAWLKGLKEKQKEQSKT